MRQPDPLPEEIPAKPETLTVNKLGFATGRGDRFAGYHLYRAAGPDFWHYRRGGLRQIHTGQSVFCVSFPIPVPSSTAGVRWPA